MKQLRFLLLLLAIIVAQGVRAQLPDGCTVMSQELQLGTNEGIAFDYKAGSEYLDSSEEPGDFNLYRFISTKHCTLLIEMPEYTNIMFFDENGIPVYGDKTQGQIATRYFVVDANKTYYVGFRSTDSAEERAHRVERIDILEAEGEDHTLTHHEAHYNCLEEGGQIEYWECNCGLLYADAYRSQRIEETYKGTKASHSFDFSQEADEYHCQEQYCNQVVYGISSEIKSISTPGFQNAVTGSGYKATYNYQIYRFVAPRTGMLAIKDVSENPVKCTVAVFDANLKYLTYNSASQYSSEGVGLYYQVTAGQEYFIGIRATATNTALENEVFKFRVNCTRHNNGTSVARVEPTCEHEGVQEHFICTDCNGIYDYIGDYIDHDESRYILKKTPHRLYNGECMVCHTKVPTYEPGEYQITLDKNHMESWGSTCTIFRVHTENHGLLSITGESDDSNFSFSLVHPSYVEEAESNNGGGALSAPRKANTVSDSKSALLPGNGYFYIKIYGDDAATATFNIALAEHPVECVQEHVEPTCTTEGKKAVYCCTGDCGYYYRFTEDGIMSPTSSQMTIPALSHEIGENGICTMCNHKVVLTDGDNNVQFLAGYGKETTFKFTPTETGRVELSVVTKANILDARIMPLDVYLNGGVVASAPRKVAPVGDLTNPYTVSEKVIAGNEYFVVFTTNEYEEIPAAVNVGYYDVYIEGETIDLATAMAGHPDVKGFIFDWPTNSINACTITRDVTLNLDGLSYPSFVGQLKVDNGAKVEIKNCMNLDFSGVSDDAFCMVVEDGDLTCRDISNIYGGSHGVLVKKGSFTASSMRIRADEAVVASKALDSTDDVAINILDGTEVWGSKVAIYMDVNGHLTIDNPDTYQGIQGDTQSIVAKAGTIDLSNVRSYAIRNNGPVGAVEDRQEPVMHGTIPYLDGVPAVALQVGTDEEGFTGTTVLRMRNVQFDCRAVGDEPDYQKILITGSASHPTRYYLTNVQGEEQIVVENEDYVNAMEPIVVNDGDNNNVLFPDGKEQLTVLKYTATESKFLEVSAVTDAIIENCIIMPWEEWDASSVANDNIQYARRKASSIGSAETTGKSVAITKVTEGNTYAILFTTTAATNSAATITLSYLDVNIPSEENDYILAAGKNLLSLDESGYIYNWAEYTFVPEKTGIVTLTCDDTSYLEVWDDDEYYKWTNDDGTILKCVLQEGVVYTVYVETDADVTTAMLTITVEDFDGTLVLDDTKDLAENLGEWRNIDMFTVPEGVVYMRNSTTSRWGTVVLPYELQSNGKVAYYELTNADIQGGKLEFAKIDVVKPNTPTVYRILDGNQYDASVDGPVTVELPEYFGGFGLYTKTKVDGWYMDGWYYQDVIDTQHDDYFMDEGIPGDPGIMYISGDKFYHATGTVTVKPYRAIFEAYGVNWNSAPSKAMRISFIDEDNITTTINSIMEENGEFTDIEAIYDLNGQRKNSIQRGVNIIRTTDGKTRKFIKK